MINSCESKHNWTNQVIPLLLIIILCVCVSKECKYKIIFDYFLVVYSFCSIVVVILVVSFDVV